MARPDHFPSTRSSPKIRSDSVCRTIMNFPSIFGAVGVVIGMLIVIAFALCLFWVVSLV